MRNDLRLALSIKLYNPPKVEKLRCNPRPMSYKQSISEAIKSLKSAWMCDR